MSNPSAFDPAFPDIDPRTGLMNTVAAQLIPLFKTASTDDTTLARRMSLSALEAYDPRTPADYVNAARTIAFSMSALALLGHAAGTDVTMAEKMRAFGRANALNRSADQSERTMMQRRRHQGAEPPAPHLDREPSAPAAVLDDATVEAAVAEAMGIYGAVRDMVEYPATAAKRSPEPAIQSNPPRSAADVMPAAPPAAAIRYVNPRPDANGTKVASPELEQPTNGFYDAVQQRRIAHPPLVSTSTIIHP